MARCAGDGKGRPGGPNGDTHAAGDHEGDRCNSHQLLSACHCGASSGSVNRLGRFLTVGEGSGRDPAHTVPARSDPSSLSLNLRRARFALRAVPRVARRAKRGAGGGTRTHTTLPSRDFKSLASTSSATSALLIRISYLRQLFQRRSAQFVTGGDRLPQQAHELLGLFFRQAAQHDLLCRLDGRRDPAQCVQSLSGDP